MANMAYQFLEAALGDQSEVQHQEHTVMIAPDAGEEAGATLSASAAPVPRPASPQAPGLQPPPPQAGRGRSEWWKSMEEPRGPSGTWWTGGTRIGSGSYGRVYKAFNTSTGEVFAVKEASVTRDADPKQTETLVRELAILQDLRHPHVVSYLGHEFVNGRLCICIEFMPGGSLRGMVNEFGPWVGELLQRATRGVLEGVNYLHTHNPLVVHRDLKGANVLMDQHFLPKLADFGCSKYSRDSLAGSQTFSTVGSIPWMAPEVICAHDQNSKHRGPGRRADIWSLGCVVLEMATAANPWGQGAFDNFLQAYTVIGLSSKMPPIPADLSPVGRDFVSLCLRRDDLQRPWAEELLRHGFVQGWTAGCGLKPG